MSSKLSKTTTNHVYPVYHERSRMERTCPEHCRGSRREPQTTAASSEERCCEDCVFSVGVKGPSDPILTCLNKAGSPGRLWIVDPDNSCDNFTADKEILAPELIRALAEGAKLIPLTQGKFAIVDAEDYERLSKYKWHVKKSSRTYYAQRQINGKKIKMHRLILNAPRHLIVDHRNHNGLDNRRANIRLCTHAQNARNRRPHRGSPSRYKGVSWDITRNRYEARIQHNRKSVRIGRFESEIAAAKAYDKKAFELFGEFAFLNFPEDYGLPRRRCG